MTDGQTTNSEWVEQLRERARTADLAGKARTAERERRRSDARYFMQSVFEDLDVIKDGFNLFEGVTVRPQLVQSTVELTMAVRRKLPAPPKGAITGYPAVPVRDQFSLLEYRIAARRDGDRYIIESLTGHPASVRVLGVLEDQPISETSDRKTLEFKPAADFISFRDDAASRWLEAMDAIDPTESPATS